MYALYLSMSGYGVETAEDGHEAIIKARTLRPDLIVMDLQMPKLDGWGAIREIQSRPAALAVGACPFLMKPCFPEQLATEVRSRLALRRSTQRLVGGRGRVADLRARSRPTGPL
jgi:two-component system, OmpR family, response regulator AdeR